MKLVYMRPQRDAGARGFRDQRHGVGTQRGVMGITYESVKQIHNQVAVGRRSGSMMSFKVNLLSIGLGMAFYL